MTFSLHQDAALLAVQRWLDEPGQQCFRLFGYAGTGKTTLARHFAESVPGNTLFAAFTGKAASVLRQKGCEGATTIHSLIYRSRQKSKVELQRLEQLLLEAVARSERERLDPVTDPRVCALKIAVSDERKKQAQPAFSLNPDSPIKDASLVIVDECSMVDGRMASDLFSFGTKVLVLGDPAQLPPVRGNGALTDDDPDFMLTEIHRQAADNPIIRMATMTREKKVLEHGDYGEGCSVVERSDPDTALAADQILVGRNKTRVACNKRTRSLRALEGSLPVAGDKLVCLKNSHDVGLLNGTVWRVAAVSSPVGDQISMEVVSDEGETLFVDAFTQPFEGLDCPPWSGDQAEQFDFGYALTVHKSQGSQWNNVMLIDESACFRADRWRHLYTGITRAAEKITVVRP